MKYAIMVARNWAKKNPKQAKRNLAKKQARNAARISDRMDAK